MLFFRRRKHTVDPPSLVRPEPGIVTGPLQRYAMDALEGFSVPGGDEPGEEPRGGARPDYSRPKPVIFSWTPPQNAVGRVRYALLLSLDESFSDPLVITDLTQPFATVSNLFVGARYYWKVRAEGKRIEPVESAVWSFQTHPAMPRWVYVPGVTNMRDIGGWELSDGRRVRQGAVYRSSAISTRRVQAQTACILIEELRVRTDLDLRAMREGARPMLDESLVQWRHVPVLAYESLATDEGLVQYREALRVFADPTNYPILCHCRAGADRVGTLVLLLLGLLGVELDDLAQDYELTSLSVWGKRSRHSGAFQAVLGCLKEFGGRPDATINEQIEGYALHAGLTPQEITRIRDTLLVSADSAS